MENMAMTEDGIWFTGNGKTDTFTGHKIVAVEQIDDFTATITLDDGTVVQVKGNMGSCCSNGDFPITSIVESLPGGIITGASVVAKDADGFEEQFILFVMVDNKKLPLVEFQGYDNGYYGSGFYLKVL